MRSSSILALTPFPVAIVALWALVIVPWQCSHVKRRSEYLILSFERAGSPSPAAITRVRDISARVHRCIQDMPNDLDLRFEAAASSLVLGANDAAVDQYREAL